MEMAGKVIDCDQPLGSDTCREHFCGSAGASRNRPTEDHSEITERIDDSKLPASATSPPRHTTDATHPSNRETKSLTSRSESGKVARNETVEKSVLDPGVGLGANLRD